MLIPGLEWNSGSWTSPKAKDAEETKRLSMEHTASFIQLVDRMFDCLNVGNYMDGKKS